MLDAQYCTNRFKITSTRSQKLAWDAALGQALLSIVSD